MKPKQVNALIKKVHEATECNESRYPALAHLPSEYQKIFKLSHSVGHLHASSGDMRKIIHEAEHGDAFDETKFKKKITSAGFTVLKLCAEHGISAEELFAGIDAYADEESAMAHVAK